MSKALAVPASVLVVGIAGPTRSGKGTLAKALRQEVPGPSIFNQDKYFKQQGETPDCIDWRTLLKELQKVLDAAGKDGQSQRKRQVVILEGFLIFASPEVAACCDVQLFLQLDRETCHERRKASKGMGLTGAAFDRNFDNSIWRSFEEHGNSAGTAGVDVLDATQAPEIVAAAALDLVKAALQAPPRERSAPASGPTDGAIPSVEAVDAPGGSSSSSSASPGKSSAVAATATAPPAGAGASAARVLASGAAPTPAPATAAEEDLSQWPLAKFRASLAHREEAPRPKNGFAVLLTTGAMNPIHLGHVQLLHQARQRLEQCGFGVVGAWASPSHDGYVLPKCKALQTLGLTSGFRVEVARRAVADDPFVAIGSWEAEFPGHWPDYPVVAKALQEELSKLPEAAKLRGPNGFPQVFYACGTDHAKKCSLYSGLRTQADCGVVVVPRAGEKAQGEQPKKHVYVAEGASGPVAGFSSTKVRAALEARDFDAVSNAMSDEAARFLLQPTQAEYDLHEQSGRNYSKLKLAPPP